MSKSARRVEGDRVTPITLPTIDNTIFHLEAMRGKQYMLSFFRFASCPFCNLRMHELVKRYNELGDNFGIVAIFDSPIGNLMHHAEGHKAPFPVLADHSNRYYKEYGIEHSLSGVFKGMLLRMPTLIKGMCKGYVPTTIQGSMTTMPADFLIDMNGIIQVAHYGNDEGDHLPFDQIKAFSYG